MYKFNLKINISEMHTEYFILAIITIKIITLTNVYWQCELLNY